MRLRGFAVLLAAVPALPACAGSADETLGTAQSLVVGGVPSGPEDDAVVQLDGAHTGCTATLVAANLVVTARHCVANGISIGFQCSLEGELLNPGPNGELGTHVDASKVRVFSGVDPEHDGEPAAYGKAIYSTESPIVCRDDIAFVVLDRSLSNPIAPIRLIEPMRVGEVVSVVGYGYPAPEVRRRLDGVQVLAVGPDEVEPGAASEAPPHAFALGKSTCFGDSGGPTLTSTGAVAGVYSIIAGDCNLDTVKNYFVEVRPFPDLIRDAFEAAGAEPWIEGAAAPGSDEKCPDCAQDSGCAVSLEARYASGWYAVVALGVACAHRRSRRRALNRN